MRAEVEQSASVCLPSGPRQGIPSPSTTQTQSGPPPFASASAPTLELRQLLLRHSPPYPSLSRFRSIPAGRCGAGRGSGGSPRLARSKPVHLRMSRGKRGQARGGRGWPPEAQPALRQAASAVVAASCEARAASRTAPRAFGGHPLCRGLALHTAPLLCPARLGSRSGGGARMGAGGSSLEREREPRGKHRPDAPLVQLMNRRFPCACGMRRKRTV